MKFHFSRYFPCSPGARRVFNTSRRRRGVAAVYVGALMIFLLMVASMVIDMNYLYGKRSQAQRAADAAALAGAWQMAHSNGVVAADSEARKYAAMPNNGGYVYGVNGANVQTVYPATDENGVVQNNWYRVILSRPERTFFALASSSQSKYVISATATALYTTNAPLNIRGVGNYGSTPGMVNLSLFGPDGSYSGGDWYSPTKLDAQANPADNGKPNPKNVGWNGYNFFVNVPSSITNPEIDVYDPDCYNKGKIATAGSGRVDELRMPDQSLASFNSDGTCNYATVTQYTVYDDNGTPYNFADDKQVAQTTYGGATARDIAADNTWIPLITNAPRLTTTSNFRVNVKSLSGSSENGYDLRAGPTLTGSQTYNPDNGSTINADGHLCLNFNTSGTSQIALGQIPTAAAGGAVSVTHFDTDVGSTSLVYTCSTLSGFSSVGNLGPAGQRNGVAYTDTFTVPSNYTTSGTWYASYAAGAGDTSVWELQYNKTGPGTPGDIKLVR